MDELRERQSSWTSSNSSSYTEATDREAPWKDIGNSMSAISFGFVATAILISMFLVMAIFEHLLRRNRGSLLHATGVHRISMEQGLQGAQLRSSGKIGSPQMVDAQFPPEVSVMMPGQDYPTYIAQPAPLPCPREGIFWPLHGRHNCHMSPP